MSSGVCPQCGNPRQGSLRFCPHCSFDYWKAAADDAPVAEPPPQPAAEPNAKGNRAAAWIGAGVVTLVLAVAAFSYLQDTANQRLTNVGNALTSINEEPGDTQRASPTPPPPAEPTDIPLTQFSPIELSGSGNAVPRFSIPEDAAAIATITHAGSENFAVWTIGADGAEHDLLVNIIGDYSGTVLFDEQTGIHSVAFRVDADGSWTITVMPVAQAFRWDQAASVTGTGDDVVLVDPPTTGLTTVDITHNGSANFAVWAYGSTGTDLLVNEIGPYAGESLLGDGTFLVEIAADGSWSITPPA
jgi:hypothetical protein